MLQYIETAITAVMRKLHSPPKSNHSALAARIAAPTYLISVTEVGDGITITATLPDQRNPTHRFDTVRTKDLVAGDTVAVFSADRWAIVFKQTIGRVAKHEHQLVYLAIKPKLSELLDTKKLGLLAIGELAETPGEASKLKFTGEVNKTVGFIRLSPHN